MTLPVFPATALAGDAPGAGGGGALGSGLLSDVLAGAGGGGGGPHKIEAIYAVLTGKYLDVLITDENTATAVLDLYQSKNNIDTERKDGALQ
jgi:hypothetical protein